MKKLCLILCMLSSALVVLLALVFTVLEATLLVTLDFLLYEHMWIALMQLLCKLVLALAAAALGVLSLIKREQPFLLQGICLLVASAVMIPLVSNHFGIYMTAVAAFFVLSRLLLCRCTGKRCARKTAEKIEKDLD